jgi:hypothetical protein
LRLSSKTILSNMKKHYWNSRECPRSEPGVPEWEASRNLQLTHLYLLCPVIYSILYWAFLARAHTPSGLATSNLEIDQRYNMASSSTISDATPMESVHRKLPLVNEER